MQTLVCTELSGRKIKEGAAPNGLTWADGRCKPECRRRRTGSDQFITAKTPAGRWGEPDDMVGPCVFLASHASDFVNGQILYADGGILAYIGRQPK